eukprot:6189132-Pleurochrysis_carterae.AAC.1
MRAEAEWAAHLLRRARAGGQADEPAVQARQEGHRGRAAGRKRTHASTRMRCTKNPHECESTHAKPHPHSHPHPNPKAYPNPNPQLQRGAPTCNYVPRVSTRAYTPTRDSSRRHGTRAACTIA